MVFSCGSFLGITLGRQRSCSRYGSSQGQPSSNHWLTGWYKDPEASLAPKLCEFSWGLHWKYFLAQFLSLPRPAFFLSFPYILISEELPNKHFVCWPLSGSASCATQLMTASLLGSSFSRECYCIINKIAVGVLMGFRGGSVGKESACQCRRCEFVPWVGKIPWRRQPTPVLLPGKFFD